MSIHKDNATGKWRVVYRYTDWTGETHQSSKRGFPTKREAQMWERELLLKKEAKLDMTFESVVVKHFCNTLFENSPGISSFKWCFPIIVGMRTDMIVPYVHISV